MYERIKNNTILLFLLLLYTITSASEGFRSWKSRQQQPPAPLCTWRSVFPAIRNNNYILISGGGGVCVCVLTVRNPMCDVPTSDG